MSENEKKRARVGRPRKQPIRPPVTKHGIVSSPMEKDNTMEFVHSSPLLFKKILHFMKTVQVGKLKISFGKSDVILWGSDDERNNKVRIKIDCNLVDHYYCSSPIDIAILNDNLKLVMNTIDKTYNILQIISNKHDNRMNLQLILKNDVGFEEIHRIELINLDAGNDFDNWIENSIFERKHNIRFNLNGKFFKKLISDISSFTEQVTIRQDGPNDPLIFEYVKRDKKINSLNIVKDNSLLDLESNLKEGESFRASFIIDFVKPISHNVLSEVIEVNADELLPLMFVSKMDEAIEIRVLTRIIDERDINL
jgi:hypothetical protein